MAYPKLTPQNAKERAFIRSIQDGEVGHLPKSKWGLAVSPDGAKGPMQIMPKTYKDVMGSMKGWDNPKKLEEAGITYALTQYRAFDGNVRRAAGAYVRGPSDERKRKPLGDRSKYYVNRVNTTYKTLMADTSGQPVARPTKRETSQMATDKWKTHPLYRQWVKANKLDRTKAEGQRRDLYNQARRAVNEENKLKKRGIIIPPRIANSASAGRQIVKAYEAKPPTAAEIAGMAKGVVDYWTYATLPASIGGIVSLGRGAYRLFNAAGKQFGKVFKSKAAALEAGRKAKPPPSAAPPQPPRIASLDRGFFGRPIQKAKDQPRVRAAEKVKQQKEKARAAREAREARERAENERILELSRGPTPPPVPRPPPKTPTRTARPGEGLYGGTTTQASKTQPRPAPRPQSRPNGKPKPQPKPKKRLNKLAKAHPVLGTAAVSLALGIPAAFITKELMDRYKVNPESAQRKANQIKKQINQVNNKLPDNARKVTTPQNLETLQKRYGLHSSQTGPIKKVKKVKDSYDFGATPPIFESKVPTNQKVKDTKKPGWLPWDWIKKSGPDTSAPAKRVYIAPFGEVTVGEDPEETARKERVFQETNYKRGGQVRKGPKKTKARRVKTKPLTLKQRSALKQHSQKHTSKHMIYMRDRMKQGDTFKDAHRKATRRVGR